MDVKQLIADYLKKEGVDMAHGYPPDRRWPRRAALLEFISGPEERFSYRKPPAPKD